MAAQSTSSKPQSVGAACNVDRPAGQSGKSQQHSGGGASAQTSKSKVQDATQEATEQIKDAAERTAESFRQTGQDFVSEKKSKAANELSTLGSAVRSAADKLRDGNDDRAARYADMAADRLEGMASYLGDQDLRSMVRQVERAARRRPELFLGGMFLVGLGISRFLKASRPEDEVPRSFSSP